MISVHGDPLGILGTPDTGGQCLYIKEVMKELVKYKYEWIDAYTRHWGDKLEIELIEGLPNCRVIRIPSASDEFIPKEQLKPHLKEFFLNMTSFVSQNNLNYDLVHSHYWDGGLIGGMIADEYNIPLVHTSHSLGSVKKATAAKDDTLTYSERIKDETSIYQRSTVIIAESSQEVEELVKTYRVIPKDKIHAIPAGVDINWFYPRGSREQAKNQLGFSNQLLVLSLGRLDPRKGFDLFVKAMPEIVNDLKHLQKRINFVISAGDKADDGKLSLNTGEQREYDKIMNLTEDLGISEYFSVIPRIDLEKVPVYYTAADVFVVPSRYETFGLVIVEAMACQTPVVATNIGGPPDIITDGKEGYTVNPELTSDLTQCIVNTIQNSSIHRQMSEHAKKTAIEKFSWAAVTREIHNLYTDLFG